MGLYAVVMLGLVLFQVGSPPRGDEVVGQPEDDFCPAVTTFRRCFVLIDSLPLDQSGGRTIASIAGLAVLADGRLLLADASDGNLKVYDTRGRLKTIVGRKGAGPGEFRSLVAPAIDRHGRVHTLDPALQRITVFDERLRFLRSYVLAAPGYYTAITPLDDGSVVVGGVSERGAGIVRFDSLGKHPEPLLPAARLMRKDSSDSWRMITAVFVARSSDRFLAVSTVQDSIWTIDRATQTIDSRPLPAGNGLATPPPPSTSSSNILRWVQRIQMPIGLHVDGGVVFVPVVRGGLTDSALARVIVWHLDGRWSRLSDAPPIVAASHGRIYGLIAVDPDKYAIGVFRRRR